MARLQTCMSRRSVAAVSSKPSDLEHGDDASLSEATTAHLGRLEGRVAQLEAALDALRAEVAGRLERYVAHCPACHGRFDLLVNHYSIGLFDNLVYVKCPHCRKAMPIVDQKDGTIALISG